jgi:hypothetical protein
MIFLQFAIKNCIGRQKAEQFACCNISARNLFFAIYRRNYDATAAFWQMQLCSPTW